MKSNRVPEQYSPKFLAALDGRCELARTLRDHAAAIAADLGGMERLSTIQKDLLARYIWAVANCSTIEEQVARMRNTDATGVDAVAAAKLVSDLTARWSAMNGHAMKLAGMLGIKRQQPEATDIDAIIREVHSAPAAAVVESDL